MNSFPLTEGILLSNKTPVLRPLPQKPTSITSQSTPPFFAVHLANPADRRTTHLYDKQDPVIRWTSVEQNI